MRRNVIGILPLVNLSKARDLRTLPGASALLRDTWSLRPNAVQHDKRQYEREMINGLQLTTNDERMTTV